MITRATHIHVEVAISPRLSRPLRVAPPMRTSYGREGLGLSVQAVVNNLGIDPSTVSSTSIQTRRNDLYMSGVHNKRHYDIMVYYCMVLYCS